MMDEGGRINIGYLISSLILHPSSFQEGELEGI
jgi:hypothetical protein